MDSSVPLTIIIPVFNGDQTLRACLRSVFTSKGAQFEVIVVDDHSNDGSLDIAASFPCRLIRHAQNMGPSAARNSGANAARGEILFFLDADILVQSDSVWRILSEFQRRPEISALFCSYQSHTTTSGFCSIYKNLLHHFTHQQAEREAATFCGGFGAIRRKVFIAMGGFDTAYRSIEDIELGYRLHQAGHRIYLAKDIQLTHCKEYSFLSLLRSDVFNRAIPWTRLMLERRVFRMDLNTRPYNVLSVPIAFLLLLSAFFVHSSILMLSFWFLLAIAFVVLNQRFLRLAWRQQGIFFACRALAMSWIAYLYSGVGLVIGVVLFLGTSRAAPSVPAGSE